MRGVAVRGADYLGAYCSVLFLMVLIGGAILKPGTIPSLPARKAPAVAATASAGMLLGSVFNGSVFNGSVLNGSVLNGSVAAPALVIAQR